MLYSIPITCDSEHTGVCLCCTALPLPVTLSIQVCVMLYRIAITCEAEHTGGCLCCTALPLPVKLSIQMDICAVHSIAFTCDSEHAGQVGVYAIRSIAITHDVECTKKRKKETERKRYGIPYHHKHIFIYSRPMKVRDSNKILSLHTHIIMCAHVCTHTHTHTHIHTHTHYT